MAHATVSAKGWVVIPKEYRDKYNLKPGTKVGFVDYGGVLTLVPIPDDPIAALHGMLAGGPSMTAELMKEHRREVEEDERYFEQLRS
jgi:AbrB family looped-hinge helix DNA binding protein